MSSQPNKAFSKLQVLVVDDSPTLRNGLRQQLAAIDISHVDEAGDANTAIKKIRDKKYDLVLMDYNLGDATNGQQVLEYLREKDLLPPECIYFMVTAEAGYAAVAAAAEQAPDDYLLKPFKPNVLAERLARHSARQEAFLDVYRMRKDPAMRVQILDKMLADGTRFRFEALRLKTLALMERGLFQQAIDVAGEALERNGALPWARLARARAMMALGRIDAAMEEAEALLAKHKHFTPAYDLKAQILEKRGQHDDALQTLQSAEQMVPSTRRSRALGQAAHRLGRDDIAREAFQKVLKQTRYSITKVHTDATTMAKIHINADELTPAIDLLDRCRVDFKGVDAAQSSALALQAQAHFKGGDAERAKQMLREAANFAIDDVETRFAIAEAHLMVGQKEEAVAALGDALAADHENPTVRARAATMLSQAGMQAQAEALIEQALASVKQQMSEIDRLIKSLQFDTALENVDALLATHPENTGALLTASRAGVLCLRSRGGDAAFVERVRGYLCRLAMLIPGNPRLVKLQDIFELAVANPVAPRVEAVAAELAGAVPAG